ncbi:MAG TPA: formylglycine-generating enzyme family protein [Spirochaetota bacterium]|nr:formylglycine-generating enzyme family protein [Spirochaetota bacterium]
MKKIVFLFFFVISTAAFLFAASKTIPVRPSNIPEDAEWNKSNWKYETSSLPSIIWYQNGNLSWLFYDTIDNKYSIKELYYENGKLEQKDQSINFEFLKKNHQKASGPYGMTYVGKQLRYHENGSVKEERCYTLVLQKDNTLKNEMCGPEVFYDETAKEVKRIEHNAKCEYGCEEVPRQNVEQLIAQIKAYKERVRVRSLVRLPVVGRIVSIGTMPKNIEIAYKPGFVLNIGDQVCCLIGTDIVTFECNDNKNGTGRFELKEDKNNKYSSISKNTEPRFYKKNEIRNDDLLKPKIKPNTGDVKVIGGIEFVYIPAGKYLQHDKQDSNHIWPVEVKAFWMTKYEVTLGEYLKYCYEKNERLPENKTDVTLNSRYPANPGFYYTGAAKFCKWFEEKHGVKTVLPEQNEWEYAARGDTATDYYWGNGKINDYCWYKKNSGGKLHPVGQKKPNAFGLYDMIGNVWEWCDPFYIRGGSCRSLEVDLQYNQSYLLNYEYMSQVGDTSYKEINDEGAGFRMIIRVP